jgi:SAM-dependent methyltransferase
VKENPHGQPANRRLTHTGFEETVIHPFDAAAEEYDAGFTRTRLGHWLRAAVRERLATSFRPGDRVLELGCGTGEDAVWLARRDVRVVATDASPAMLSVARRKTESSGLGGRVLFAQLDLANAAAWAEQNGQSGEYDGAFSSFGALNCLSDRRQLAMALASLVRPRRQVVVVLMGPVCPWEIAWHLAHGQVRTAFRRFQSGTRAHVGGGRTTRVWYPSPRRLRREFLPYFRHLETVGVGTMLPPSYLSHLVDRWPGIFDRLAAMDGRLGNRAPWTWLNDHYMVRMERV